MSSTNAFDAIGEAVENSSTDNDSSDDSDGGYEALPYLKLVPTTVISGEITDVFWTGSITQDGEVVVQQDSQRTSGSWGFTFENPKVLKGTAYENETLADEDIDLARKGSGSSVDYRVFDKGDDGFTENFDVDGNVKSVANSNTDDFHANEVEAIDADKITVFVSSLAGQFVTRALDVNGGHYAYVDDDGNNTNGLIEFPSDWDNGAGESGMYPRVARYPELREDLEGEEIFMYIGLLNGGPSYEGKVGTMDDLADALADLDEGETLDSDTLSNALISPVFDKNASEYDSVLAWDEVPDNADTPSDDFDIGTDNGGEPDHDLTESQVNLAKQVLAGMDDGDVVEDMFEDFSAMLESNMAKNTDSDQPSIPNTTDTEEMRNFINSRNN